MPLNTQTSFQIRLCASLSSFLYNDQKLGRQLGKGLFIRIYFCWRSTLPSSFFMPWSYWRLGVVMLQRRRLWVFFFIWAAHGEHMVVRNMGMAEIPERGERREEGEPMMLDGMMRTQVHEQMG